MADSPADPIVSVVAHPDAETASSALRLLDEAAAADGIRPFSEAAILRLRHPGDGDPASPLFVLGHVGDELAAVGFADPATNTAELVVHPGRRGRGIGSAVLHEVERVGGDGLRVWAHGDLPVARAFAERTGLRPLRVLWQLRRSLRAPIPDAAVPEGVSVRPFRRDQDEQAWVDLNARAFADHPEQGRWTVADLRQRMAEPWFDPNGFFLAEREGRLVGFHWTKVHSGAHPLGEVYVVGTAPDERGSGLGKALTVRGLQHLREQGLDTVLLYVDESNQAAMRLYDRLGFTGYSTDVAYGRPDAG